MQRGGEEIPGVSDEQVSAQSPTFYRVPRVDGRGETEVADWNSFDGTRNLMAQEDLSKLGFKDHDKQEDQKAESVRSDGKKPRGGFVAGIPKS